MMRSTLPDLLEQEMQGEETARADEEAAMRRMATREATSKSGPPKAAPSKTVLSKAVLSKTCAVQDLRDLLGKPQGARLGP